jgi:hypothetical protein
VTVVTGILGFGLKDLEKLGEWWVIVPTLLLNFLGCTTLLTWFAGNGNAKMGSYLVVFYEEEGTENDSGEGWESRLDKMNALSRVERLSLNWFLVWLYLVLGLVSFFVPLGAAAEASTKADQLWGPLQIMAVAIASLIFAGPLILILKFSYTRVDYKEEWRRVREEEQQGKEQSQEP